jgi:eukaryotic-like serine/threonine-protein kinase
MEGALREGDLIGSRFRLDRPLGEGGFAVVWAATHTVTRRRVALKLLKESFAADVRVRQRFLREARVASAVRHPNVIAIQDVFEHEGGRPVIVMDLLDGESLGDRIRRAGALPLDEVATILLPVVSAVECAHGLGIVHRDLKPDNIFLARAPASTEAHIVVTVLDFGIAKLTAREGDAARSGGLTRTGALLGTPYYMSPEQIFGDGEVDARSDVWSLGVVLYECLAGVRPTQADSVGQIIRIIASDAIVPLEQRKPELPREVTDIVKRALSFDNAARPTVPELKAVVAAHAGSAAILLIAPSAGSSLALDATEEGHGHRDARESTQAPVMVSTSDRRGTRRRVWIGLAAALAAASGAGLVVWYPGAHAAPPLVYGLVAAAPPSPVLPAPASTPAASASVVSPEPGSAERLVTTRSLSEPVAKRATRAGAGPTPARGTPTSASASPTPADPASYQ